jgi:manganese/zinc/iron transport system permease protein
MTELAALLNDFTVRSVALGAATIGAVAGALGTFALLRRESLLGDVLSHAALPGIVIGFLISGGRALAPMLGGALVSGILAALLVLLLTRRTRLKDDAALGIALSLFFAVGTMLLTFAQRTSGAAQAGLESFLFGRAAAVLPSDLGSIAVVGGAALATLLLAWPRFTVVTFDRDFARSLGLPVAALEATLTLLIALAVVIGLQLVGVILMVALLVAPAAAARQFTQRLAVMTTLSAAFGASAGIAGALASATTRGLSTGPVIVLFASAIAVAALLFAPERGLLGSGLRALERRRNLTRRSLARRAIALGERRSEP